MHHFVVSTSQFVVFLPFFHKFTMLLLSLIIAVLGFIMTFVLHSQLSLLVYHYVLFPLPVWLYLSAALSCCKQVS